MLVQKVRNDSVDRMVLVFGKYEPNEVKYKTITYIKETSYSSRGEFSLFSKLISIITFLTKCFSIVGVIGIAVIKSSSIKLADEFFYFSMLCFCLGLIGSVILGLFTFPKKKLVSTTKRSDVPTYENIIYQLTVGNKTILTSGYIFYELYNINLPSSDDVNILYSYNGRPILELKTKFVEIYEFDELFRKVTEPEIALEEWKQQINTELNYELQNYYLASQNNNLTANLWGNGNISIKNSSLDLPISNKELGIRNYRITGAFKVVCEKVEVTKIFEQTYSEWRRNAIEFLRNVTSIEEAKVDVDVLLQFVLKKGKSHILAFPETTLTSEQITQLSSFLIRREKGEPIAYILGETDFWTLTLNVSPDTLIPRPDTEILVEQALSCIQQLKDLDDFESPIRILDLGTGTGAIALALASELKKSGEKFEVWGVDFIENAVKLAQANAVRNHLTEVQFFQSSWFEQVTGQFDLIVSNPPYIDAEDQHLSQGDVRFEPLTALVAEEQGYADLRHIIEQAPHYLKQHGFLLLEHGWQQGQKVRSIFSEILWQQINTVEDYAGNPRVTLARLK